MSNLISVTQFNTYIHNIFYAEELLQNISIYGEVSALSFSGGNLYFSIKDDGAVLNCVKFGCNGAYLPKEGDQVLVIGSPNYYIKGGRFSFNVVRIEPYGQGLLYKKFLELKNKLESQGLFDSANKKSLPEIIKRVGVVSSETGAVIQDIIDITGRRNPMLDIVLYPAKVQGIGAESTIISGIKALDKTDVDVIIIARGGGSAEDLSTFNDEKLAYAIFEAKKPIISAVGHETDFTIADFVADIRAPTPSAAAELVAIDLVALKRNLYDYVGRLLYLTQAFYDVHFQQINAFGKQILSGGELLINQKQSILLSNMLSMKLRTDNLLQQKSHNFELLTNRLENVNPIKILRRGYGQVAKGNNIIKSINQVTVGDDVVIKLSDGKIKCVVKDKEE